MKQDDLSAAQIYKNMAIIWLAMFSSQIMFLIAIFAAKPELLGSAFGRPALGEDAATIAIFAALSLILLAGSFVMRKRFRDQAIEKHSPGILQTGLIVGCAMCEAVSLFGLVLGFSRSYPYFFVWIAAAMAGMVFHFPSRKSTIDAGFRNGPGI